MAKFKLAKPKSTRGASGKPRGAVPCIILVVGIMALLTILFALALRG